MAKSFLRRHIITIFAHISGWGIFFAVPLLMRSWEVSPEHINNLPLEIIIIFFSLLIGVFYVNFWVLIPRVLNKFGTRFYVLSVVGLWLIFTSIAFFIIVFLMKNRYDIPYFAHVFPFTMIVALSLSIRLLIDKSKIEQQQNERENETLKSELSFLRSQISPHFLFNIMNNVVALSRVKPEKVEPTLIQLSHLMRYMLYNTDERKVSIAKEIEYLESYIDLQKLRFGDSIDVVFEKNIEQNNAQIQPSTLNPHSHQIEPMLLIPFVENAFKHGTGMVQNPEIKISIVVRDNQLIFNVLNKFDPLSIETKDKDSGIGLKNVSRRLDLLYAENQTLDLSNEGGVFKVDLKILLG
jgi:two-component system, LytTR family, sensor kinase